MCPDNKYLWHVYRNSRVVNGAKIRGSFTLLRCLDSCVGYPGCAAILYNEDERSCSHFTEFTVNSNPMHPAYCCHYAKVGPPPKTHLYLHVFIHKSRFKKHTDSPFLRVISTGIEDNILQENVAKFRVGLVPPPPTRPRQIGVFIYRYYLTYIAVSVFLISRCCK